ncbi:ABC transporter permease [Escherichia coli]|nr:ABC transporter permease [Escherichia coli]
MPQLAALLLVLLVDSLVAPHFWQVVLQDGRLFGSPIDILNRAAPVALLAIGMTLVIATGGIDLSVGAVMAIAGATTAAMTVAGFSLPIVLLSALGTGILGGIVERHTGSDPQNSAVCCHPDPDGRRARRGATDHLRTDRHV